MNTDRPTLSPPSPGSRFVFWMLLSLGLATFTPCILLPEWRAFEAGRIAEQKERQKIHVMEATVDREKRLLEGMQSDPGVIARIAQRDLHFRHPTDRTVPVLTESLFPTQSAAGSPDSIAIADFANGEMLNSTNAHPGSDAIAGQPPVLPAFVTGLLARLPEYDYDALFCDPETRPIIMGLSVALIAAAVLIFSARRTGPGSLG